MPLTRKARLIKRAMQKKYGKVKGTQVFYESIYSRPSKKLGRKKSPRIE